MVQPTARHLSRLSRLTRRLDLKRVQMEEVQRTLERVRRAGSVVRGETWMLGEVGKLQDEARRMLAALESSETTQEATDRLRELDELLGRPEWELAERVLSDLENKQERLAGTRRDLEDQIGGWNEKLNTWEGLLVEAKRLRAPVIHEERLLQRLRDTLTRAEQALRDQELGQVPVLLAQLQGRGDRPSGVEPAAEPELEKLDESIADKIEETRRVSRNVGLLLLRGPLLDEGYKYTVLLRTAGEPGMQHGVSIHGTSSLMRRDRAQMAELIEQVTGAVNQGLVRSFSQRRRASGKPAEVQPLVAASDAQHVADADLGEMLRFSRPAWPAGQRPPPLEVDELARSMGDLMYRLLLPAPMQDYLERKGCSITITTNDLELPWELMWYRGQFLCLAHPVARVPMGGEFPREGHPPVRPDGKSRFLLIYADPEGNLPAAEREVDRIQQALEQGESAHLVHVDVWKGKDAEGRALTDALRFGSYDVIHYAGHSSFNSVEPERSGLLLHQSEVFSAQRVRRLLEGRPLVYLNACESGRVANEDNPQVVQEYSQERAEGLASALIYGGALGCIGALWPVYDRPAAEFAIEFYNRVLEGYMIGEAMRQARNEIKRRHQSHVTWAAFVLYGDPTYRLVE